MAPINTKLFRFWEKNCEMISEELKNNVEKIPLLKTVAGPKYELC